MESLNRKNYKNFISNGCKYQIILKDFPYYCCIAQKYCPPVFCPYNYMECPIYLKNINDFRRF